MSVKVGDKIRITNARDNGGAYNNGDILVVADIPKAHSRTVLTEESYYITGEEYEIITNEEDGNMKAEKGDLIRIIDKAPQVTAFEVGGIYEVIGYSEEGTEDEQVIVLGIGGRESYVDHVEYVIHRKAGEEEECRPSREHLAELRAEEAEQDAVNSPNHYTQGKFETIEIIEHLTSKYDDGFTAHCVGTAFKYMDRAPYKHDTPTECLRKAAKYLEFAIERLDAKSTQK